MASLNSNARTDAASVKEIFETSLSDGAIKAHINAAAAVVDDIAAADSSVSGTRLELIETYVAAHFASTQDPRESQASVGDADFRYRGPSDTTQYWETATSLDPTGVLAGGTTQVDVEVLEGR